jgi:hypothetical protein
MAVEAVAKQVAVEAPPTENPAADAPPPKKRLKEITVDLEMPVPAHGETLSKITFRRPTGADLIAMGDAYPIHFDVVTGDIRPNPPAMAEMMTTLAAVPMSTIKLMDAEDFATCAYALMGFFPPRRGWWRF